MSSDEEPIDIDALNSDIENNALLEVGEDLNEFDENENTEEVERDEAVEGGGNADKTVVQPKRVIRNPQPKLNEETLKGPRGIATIQSHFEQVKFKGKGHENEDLAVIMKTYEYWCHRLFPKFPFDTCIERLEKLGTKKAVQTHIKRIRFDLLIDEDKPIIDSSDEEANVGGFVDVPVDEINLQNQRFDSLQATSVSSSNQNPTELSEEQLERIKLNKERAEKLRQERLKKIREKAEASLELSSQQPSTSSLFNEIDSQDNQVPVFDLESNVKGKSTLKGGCVKKSSKNRLLDSDEEIEGPSEINDNSVNNSVTPRRKNTIESDTSDQEMEDVSNEGIRSRRKVQNILGSDEELVGSELASGELQLIEESKSQHINGQFESIFTKGKIVSAADSENKENSSVDDNIY